MPDLHPLCPAAIALDGPPLGGPSILCSILRREGEAQDGILEGEGHELLTARGDPSLVFGFCCGRGVPAATVEQAKGEAKGHHTYCTIWQQEKERIWAADDRAWRGRSKIAGDVTRGPQTPMDIALAEAGL